MKATHPWLEVLLCAGVSASLAAADPGWPSYPPGACYQNPCPNMAPDACGPGYYGINPYGAAYGPCYNLVPPFPPCGAVTPDMFPPPSERARLLGGRGGRPLGRGHFGHARPPEEPEQPAPLVLPTHPFAHSPRDYFMMD